MNTDFDGTFSSEQRALLRARRLSLHISMARLSSCLGIHWSTIGKWESGAIKGCHPRHRQRVAAFLAGEYDSWLKFSDDRAWRDGKQACPDSRQARKNIMNLSCAFHLLEAYPDLQNLLVCRLNSVMERIMLQRLSRLN